MGDKLPGWITHNWIVLPVIALTIYAVTQGGMLARLLGTRLLVWCGHISYSFYSFQIVLLLMLKSQHAAIVAALPALQDNRVLLLAAFAVLMLMAAFGYHCIEEPCRKWIRRRGKERSARAPSAAAAS
jgi:peptidoglycan/LPS O-acetylase OafA/YrhL